MKVRGRKDAGPKQGHHIKWCHYGWLLVAFEQWCDEHVHLPCGLNPWNHRVSRTGLFDLFSLVPDLLFPVCGEYQPCHVHTSANVPVCTQIAVNSEAWFDDVHTFWTAAPLAMTASPSLVYHHTTKCQPTQRPLFVRHP